LDIIEASGSEIDVPDTERGWIEFQKQLNDSLNDLDLEFRHFRDEEEGRAWFGLVRRFNSS
jgi:hypothetical protein